MAITFERARELVEQELAPRWGDTGGTFYVDTTGLEDDDAFVVGWGAREFLVDGDLSFLVPTNTVTLVDRVTGLVVELPRPDVEARLDAMREISIDEDTPS